MVTDRQTDRHTNGPSTLTLTIHVCRGLMKYCDAVYLCYVPLICYLMGLDSKMDITGQRFLNTRWRTWYGLSITSMFGYLSKVWLCVQVQL